MNPAKVRDSEFHQLFSQAMILVYQYIYATFFVLKHNYVKKETQLTESIHQEWILSRYKNTKMHF